MVLTQKVGAVSALVATLVATAPIQANASDLRRDERRARRLVNVSRDAHDLAPLQADAQLSKLARKHSRKMAGQHELFHRSDLSAGLAGITWSLVGENVGVGENVRQVHKAFMNSAPHRHNLLNPSFDEIGVGVVDREGRSWVTLIFLG